MKKLILALAAVAALTTTAHAQAKPKLTIAQALSVLVALRNLDGHMAVVKQGAQEVTIMVPWEFGSGVLRARIAGDLSLLEPVEKTTEDARQHIAKEITAKMPPDKDGKAPQILSAGTAEFADYQKQYNDVLNADCPVSDSLARIKMSALKLDKNEIPVTALSALAPILDDDLSK
jgi:hypothetical protein